MLDEEKWVYNFCKQAHAGRVNDEAFAYIKVTSDWTARWSSR